MKTKFYLVGATMVAAALIACGEGNSTTDPNDPSAVLSSASSDDPNLPLSSATDNGISSATDPVPGSSAVEPVPGSSATDPIPASSATEPVPGSSASDPVPESSAVAPESSSSMPTPVSSSSVLTEKSYAFGYPLKNTPRPSKGCGKTSTLKKTKDVENGSRYELNVNGENREYFITLPQNYDNNKPYKILFAMHCMGSNAEDFVHHSPDQDHPTPYYGQQKLDTEGNYIFVAPRGDTDGMPWSMSSDKDHKFFDQLLTTMEENYCIDTTRVFVTGFSFGSMYTYSLGEEFQDRIRAIVTYAVADYNIYEPHTSGKNKKLPIAWMAVHGKNDGTCPYNTALTSALPRVLMNSGKASDGDSKFTDASSETPQEVGGNGHLCYDFKTVDERFPIKWCSWNGGHQWTAYDNGNWQNTWVPDEVHKFLEQF